MRGRDRETGHTQTSRTERESARYGRGREGGRDTGWDLSVAVSMGETEERGMGHIEQRCDVIYVCICNSDEYYIV